MDKNLSKNPHLVPYEEGFKKRLKNPGFKKIWEAGAARRAAISAILGERLKQKLSQEELARRAGLKQPNVARVESGRVSPSIDMLGKLAQGFDKELEIKFA